MSASNLFKAHGLHGLLLFKHHDPLVFSHAQLADMLAVAAAWFAEARRSRPAAIHPLLLWNCLPRSGASQFHGHTQTMLSDYPFPEVRAGTDAGARCERTLACERACSSG